MFDDRQLQTLACVIEEQSFEKAARKLHITQSAVSQRIKQLEESFAQILLLRTQPIRPTPQGQQLLKYFRQSQLLQRQVLQSFHPASCSGFSELAIGVNADSLATWFLPALQPLLAQQPIVVDIKVDDQDQTRNLLKNGEVIGCVSASPTPLQGCHCIPLGVMVYRCVATSAFIARYFADGVNRTTLQHAPMVEFNHKDQLQQRYLQRFFALDTARLPTHRVPSSEAFMEIIMRGLATGMVPELQAKPYLDSGQVVDIQPDYYLAVPLYWHIWSLKAPLAEQLTRCLTDCAVQTLDPFDKHPQLTHP